MLKIDISTDEKGTRVFRNDKYQFPKYSVSISRKNDSGEWESCFFDARFKKGVEVNDKAEIVIKKAFMSFNVSNGKAYPYIMITDFVELSGGVVQAPVDSNGFVQVPEGSDEELPFS